MPLPIFTTPWFITALLLLPVLVYEYYKWITDVNRPISLLHILCVVTITVFVCMVILERILR